MDGRIIRLLCDETGEWLQYRILHVHRDVLDVVNLETGAQRQISIQDPLLDWHENAEPASSVPEHSLDSNDAAEFAPDASRAVYGLNSQVNQATLEHERQAAYIREFQLEDERKLVDQLSHDTEFPRDAMRAAASLSMGSAPSGFGRSERAGYGTDDEQSTGQATQRSREGGVKAPPSEGSLHAPSNIYVEGALHGGDGGGAGGPAEGSGAVGGPGLNADSGLEYSFHSHSHSHSHVTSSPPRGRSEDRSGRGDSRHNGSGSGTHTRGGRADTGSDRRDHHDPDESGARGVPSWHATAPASRSPDNRSGMQSWDSSSLGESKMSSGSPVVAGRLQGGMQAQGQGQGQGHGGHSVLQLPGSIGIATPFPADYSGGFCRPYYAAESIASLVLRSVSEGHAHALPYPMRGMVNPAMQGALAGSVCAVEGAHSLCAADHSGYSRVFVRVCVVQAGAQIQGSGSGSSPPNTKARRKVEPPKVSAPGTRPAVAGPNYSVKPDLRINPLTSRRTPIFKSGVVEVRHGTENAGGHRTKVIVLNEGLLAEADAEGAGEESKSGGSDPSVDFTCSMSNNGNAGNGLATGAPSATTAAGSSASLDWQFLRGYFLFQLFQERNGSTTVQNVLLGQCVLRICDIFAACAQPHHPQYSVYARTKAQPTRHDTHGVLQQEFTVKLWLPMQACDPSSGANASQTVRYQGGGATMQGGRGTQVQNCALQVHLTLVLPSGIVVPSEALRVDSGPMQPIVAAASDWPLEDRPPTLTLHPSSPSPAAAARSSAQGSPLYRQAQPNRANALDARRSPVSGRPVLHTQGVAGLGSGLGLGLSPKAGALRSPSSITGIGASRGLQGYLDLPAANIYAPAHVARWGAVSAAHGNELGPSAESGPREREREGTPLRREDRAGPALSSPSSFRAAIQSQRRLGSAHRLGAGGQAPLSAGPPKGAMRVEPPPSPMKGISSPKSDRAKSSKIAGPSPYLAPPAGALPPHVPFGPQPTYAPGHELGVYPANKGQGRRPLASAWGTGTGTGTGGSPLAAPGTSNVGSYARYEDPTVPREGASPTATQARRKQSSPVSSAKKQAQQAFMPPALMRGDSAGSLDSQISTGAGAGLVPMDSVQIEEHRHELSDVRGRIHALQEEMERMQALLRPEELQALQMGT